MDVALPKRMFREGSEPQVEKINNSCRMSLMKRLRTLLPEEYGEVKKDHVFSNVLAINENGLGYSGTLIHSFLSRQIVASKLHELWFVFARIPLRFSEQEFYAITGLKFKEEEILDFDKWKDDMGFWSKLLKRRENISLRMIKKEHLKHVHKWTYVDRVRLIYVCLIASVLIAKDEKANISHTYIKMVMDIDKLRRYPWGRDAFDELIKSAIKAREEMKHKRCYVLDGFSYALQIWIMEAIPLLGKMLGKKKNLEFKGPCCGNWLGAAKVSYAEINTLESSFGSDCELFPYISSAGNIDILESADFLRMDEKKDERVDLMAEMIKNKFNWGDMNWDFQEEPDESIVEVAADITSRNDDDDGAEEYMTPNAGVISSSSYVKKKKKFPDVGAETRKKKVLCQRFAATQGGFDEDIKSFLKGLIQTSFTSFEEKMDNRFVKLESDISQLKDSVKLATFSKNEREPSNIFKPPSATPLKTKIKDESRVGFDFNFSNLHDVDMTFNSNIDMELDTQEYLRKTMDQLSQDSVVKGFDPMQQSVDKDPVEFYTPLTSFQPFNNKTPHLTDDEKGPWWKVLPDSSLVHYTEEEWTKLQTWSMSPLDVPIGPSVFSYAMASRILGLGKWLHNPEIDAVMYIFRENTHLKRWKPDRVAFMSCLFGVQIRSAYQKFLADKRKFKLDTWLLDYGKGELPLHGRNRKIWDVDIDRIYVPVFVSGNHWISLCITFSLRRIEVFDCSGMKYNKEMEAFAVIIPRIVKAVQTTANKKHQKIVQYEVSYLPMKPGINSSCGDCGVFALKHIECHLFGLDLSLMDDENILAARYKIAIDLFQAAHDPVLVERRALYTPPPHCESDVVEIN